MSDFALGLASFPLLLLLIALRAPIGLAMLALGAGGLWLVTGSPGGARIITTPDSKIPVIIIPTNEELQIALATVEVLKK